MKSVVQSSIRYVLAAAVGAGLSASALAADLKVGLSVSLSGPNSSLGVPIFNERTGAEAISHGKSPDLIGGRRRGWAVRGGLVLAGGLILGYASGICFANQTLDRDHKVAL